MQDYKVYNNVDRKMIQIKSGHKYLVDFICLEEKDGKPTKYLAFGHETSTNKCYGWVELPGGDPVESFVSYVKMTDEIEKDEFIKEMNKKHT